MPGVKTWQLLSMGNKQCKAPAILTMKEMEQQVDRTRWKGINWRCMAHRHDALNPLIHLATQALTAVIRRPTTG